VPIVFYGGKNLDSFRSLNTLTNISLAALPGGKKPLTVQAAHAGGGKGITMTIIKLSLQLL